jgi:hypothetical protein
MYKHPVWTVHIAKSEVTIAAPWKVQGPAIQADGDELREVAFRAFGAELGITAYLLGGGNSPGTVGTIAARLSMRVIGSSRRPGTSPINEGSSQREVG